jgi:hypothetical protein
VQAAVSQLLVGYHACLGQKEKIHLFFAQRKEPGALTQALLKICLGLHNFSFRLKMVLRKSGNLSPGIGNQMFPKGNKLKKYFKYNSK